MRFGRPAEAKEAVKKECVNERRAPGLLQDILALLIKIFVILTVLVLLFTFLFGFMIMPDMSMQPAVQAGDIVLYYRPGKEYMAADVVVLEYEGKQQVRRVIATAGDTVDMTGEGLLINGASAAGQKEQEMPPQADGVRFPLTVPEGQVFLLADHPTDGPDSRMYGTVAIDTLQGKVITVIRHRDI